MINAIEERKIAIYEDFRMMGKGWSGASSLTGGVPVELKREQSLSSYWKRGEFSKLLGEGMG